MAYDLNGFNAEEVQPMGDFTPLPEGEYTVLLTGDEEVDNKSGPGSNLKLEFTVYGGEFDKRKLFTRLNLNHPKSDTVKFARAELSAICRAVGVMHPRSTIELHNIPLIALVKLEKRKDTGALVNRIAGYKARSASAAPQSQPAQPAEQEVNTTRPAPWLRQKVAQ